MSKTHLTGRRIQRYFLGRSQKREIPMEHFDEVVRVFSGIEQMREQGKKSLESGNPTSSRERNQR